MERTNLALLSLVLVLASCGDGGMQRLRTAQYPPDFHYITGKEIRTKMGELAVQVVALDAMLSRDGGARPADRDTVLEILTTMRTLAGQLVRGGAHSSHPRLDRDAPRLRADIDRAIAELRMSEPPSYYQAGRVVGSCTYCHATRHAEGGAGGPTQDGAARAVGRARRARSG
jgi:hypothetical protein